MRPADTGWDVEAVPDSATLLPAWVRYPLLFVLFLSLYLLYGQTTFYKADGEHIVHLLARREPRYPTHMLMVPALIAFRDLWQALALPEITPFRTATIFSALSGALAVLVVRRVGRLIRLPGAFGWFAALLSGLTPAPFFFATVVEFHAFHSLFATLALWAATSMAINPTALRGLVLAGAMTLGYLSHSSGVLLPTLCVPWALALRWSHRAAVLRASAVAVGAFALLLVGVGLIGSALGFGTPGAAAGYLAGFAAPRELWIRISAVPHLVVGEFLGPYFPLWLLVPLGLMTGGGRVKRLVLALVFPFSAYLALCALLIWNDPEKGAYFIPLAAPLALVGSAACSMLSTGKTGHGLALVACIVATTASLVTIARHDRPDDHLAWIGSAKVAVQGRPTLLLVGAKEELDALLLEGDPIPHESITLLLQFQDPAQAAAVAGDVIAGKLASGWSVILTAGAVDFLDRNHEMPQVKAFLAMEPKRFARERVENGAFVGWKLSQR